MTDEAYLKNFTVTVSIIEDGNMNSQMCGNANWSLTVSPVSWLADFQIGLTNSPSFSLSPLPPH